MLKKLNNSDEEQTDSKITIKRIFWEWAETSTSHGFPHIFRTKFIAIKIMWLIFLFISTCLCGYMVMKSILDYLSFDVITKIRVQNEVPMEFPTITICNLNPFYKNQTLTYMQQVLGYNFSDFGELNETDFNKGNYFLSNFLNEPSFSDQKRKEVGPSIDLMLISCLFMSNTCSKDDFEWYFMLDYGNCFRFNSGINSSGDQVPIKKVYSPGVWTSFNLQLYVDDSSLLTNFWQNNGIKVFVHNKSVYPSSYLDSIDLIPGTSTNVLIKKYYTNKLPYPYSDCEVTESYSSDLYNKIIAKNLSYTQKDCVFYCLQKDIIQKCGCYDTWYARIDTTTDPCKNKNQTDCSYERYFLFVNGERLFCMNECPIECESMRFELLPKHSEFPTESYYSYLKKNPIIKSNFEKQNIHEITYEMIKKRVLYVHFYFDELTTTRITEIEKMTIVDLAAGIGGIIKAIFVVC
jgi:hypothetical protein